MLTRRRLIAAAGLALVLLLAGARPAGAHTELASTEPPSGAALPPGTTEIVLRFTEPVEAMGASVTLRTAAGAPAPLAVAPGPTPEVLVAALPPGTTGVATIEWAARAADGHDVTGSLGYGSAPAPAAPVTPGAADAATADRLLTGARIGSYLAMAILVGGAAFVALAWPAGAAVRSTRTLLWVAAGGGLLATLLGVAAQAALLRRDLDALWQADAWRAVAATASGRAWLARAALFALVAPLVRALPTAATASWRVAGAAVGIGLLRTPGFAAHATEGDGAVLGSIADLAHLAGVAVWLGGLVVLALVVLPRRRPEELAEVVPRFSRLALAAMVVVVGGGALLSWQLVGGFGALFDTEFGRTLLVKLALFGGVIVAARRSQRFVDVRLRAAAVTAAGVRPLVVSVAAEVLLAVAVVAAAGVLVGTNPPS